ncbi:MAG: hypothetical protein GY832_29995 [Chloroflexi bacterium]|nr:hypothetical protein [Chloroflexota bacterium]
MKRIRQVFWIVSLTFIFVFVLSGCSVKSDRSEKSTGDWSRGLLLGRTDIKQPVSLQVDSNKHAHLVWCEIVDGGDSILNYARLNEQGQVLVNASMGIDLPNPRKAQLLIDSEDNLHMAWLSRSGGQQGLYHTLIDQDGQPTPSQDAPLLLSREEEDIDSFQMYLSVEGKTSFVWNSQLEANNEKGIFHLVLHDASPTLLIPNGIEPFVLVDNTGTIHLTWLYQKGLLGRDVYYATLEGSQIAPEGGNKLTDFELGEGAVSHGPIIGADTNNIYVIWAVQNLGGGLTPTAAFAYYVSFELGKPMLTNSHSVRLPTNTVPPYTEYASPYSYNQLVLLPSQVFGGSDFTNAPSTVQSQETELPVTFSLMVASTSKTTMQLVTLVMSEGEPIGYQFASNTKNASVRSTMVTDADSNLHMAWIDTAGFRQYDIYYASTSPEVKMWLDRTSGDDLVLNAANLIWGIISGIGLMPIVAIWNFPSLIWIVLFHIFSGREYLDQLATKIGMFVSIIIYVASKLFLLPGLSEGTPFLYQVPGSLTTIIALAIPAIILLVSIGAIYIYTRRSERATIFKAYLVFALVDGISTVILYAPGLFNPR